MKSFIRMLEYLKEFFICRYKSWRKFIRLLQLQDLEHTRIILLCEACEIWHWRAWHQKPWLRNQMLLVVRPQTCQRFPPSFLPWRPSSHQTDWGPSMDEPKCPQPWIRRVWFVQRVRWRSSSREAKIGRLKAEWIWTISANRTWWLNHSKLGSNSFEFQPNRNHEYWRGSSSVVYKNEIKYIKCIITRWRRA